MPKDSSASAICGAVGSILAGPVEIGSYKVEGIGYDFIPDVLDRDLVDEWFKSEDGPSFRMSRQLIRQEGLLVGGSSGSAVWAARELAKREGLDTRIVTILPDSVRNYMTKCLDEAWMRENGISQLPVLDDGKLIGIVTEQDLLGKLVEDRATLSSAVAEVKFRSVNTIHRDADAGQLLDVFAKNEIGLIVDDDGALVGLITKMDLVDFLAAKHA